MLFKWYPWDVMTNLVSIGQQETGFFAFSFYDSFIEKMVLEKFKSYGDQFHLVFGNEITRDWIDENLRTLDLFSGNESYLIKSSESIPKDVLKYLAEGDNSEIGRKVVLSFTGGGRMFSDFCKNDWVEGIQVQAPRFWESQKYLDFLCKERKVVLSYDVQSAILKMMEPTTANFIHALELIELHFPGQGQKCDVATLQALISGNKLDQFSLASTFNARKFKSFYQQLIDEDWDFDSLRTFFGFMQSHLIKIMDPSYMQEKARPSKYDKEIELAARSWNTTELDAFIKLFGKLEIQAKKRSPDLRGNLRQLYLKQIS